MRFFFVFWWKRRDIRSGGYCCHGKCKQGQEAAEGANHHLEEERSQVGIVENDLLVDKDRIVSFAHL